jgi:polar amino acid transport system substrate-binding protein
MRTAIVLACLLLARGALAGEALARVRQAGVLRWAGDLQGGEPFVSQDPRDPSRLVGFEVEVASGIARALGVRAQFVESDWSTLIPSLERGGSFDVAMNGIEVMPSRSARVAFTRPYYVFTERLIARRGDARVRASLDALRGLRVGTLASSFAFELVRDRAEVVPYEGVQEPYLDLEHGRTDAVLLDDIIARRYGEPNPALAVVGDVAEGYYAVAVPRNEPELRGAIDGAIAAMTASGELEAILRRADLWSAREERLARWTDEDQARMVAANPSEPAPSMTPRHALLFVQGALMTLLVSTLAMMVAVPLGLGLAVARRWGPSWLGTLATGYVEIYRGTPVLLQLYVLYYGLAPIVRVGALTAAVVGLGMNYAAYEAEAYRAGIQAVPRGQTEAALSLGMSLPLLLRRIVLPQAFRHALPNVTNDFIALLKDSSLVSVITVVELTKQMTITAIDVRGWLAPGVLCAALYLAMSWPLSFLARKLEARLARA